ncbi:MAG: AAA family ATPase [Planctomycetota bacterium]
MNDVTRLALVDPDDRTRRDVKNLLLGLDMVWLEAETGRYDGFEETVAQSRPDLALVALDGDPQRALTLVNRITHEVPDCTVLTVSSSQEGSLILQAMRAGAKEFLSHPLRIDDFVAALDRIRQAGGHGGEDGKPVRGNRVIAVAGVSGGVGCTSLAVNLGCALAERAANSVTVIDLDLALGDADVWLDIIPDYTIQDVAENLSRLDYSLLKRSLTRHDCGAFLLPRPVQMEEMVTMGAEDLKRVIALLRATFSHLVLDIGKSYGALDQTVLDAADDILLVCQLDLPALRNVVRVLQYLDLQDQNAPKVKIILNRMGLTDRQISVSKAMETIGREVYWKLPNDYGTMIESRNNGVPLITHAPTSRLTESVRGLAAKLDGIDKTAVSPAAGSSKSLFRFLSKSAA